MLELYYDKIFSILVFERIYEAEAVREFFNQSYDYNNGEPILHKR